jgi:hypothetical protein
MESTRNLTPEQITDLFAFCEEQGVYHYDVQVELVDHLACAIEQKWEANPGFSYDYAFRSVYNDFEPKSFVRIRREREKELRRKYNRLQWNYIAEFYRLPKIILTIAITFALFLITRFTENDLQVNMIILGAFVVGLILYLSISHPEKRRLDIIRGKSFLLYDHFLMWKWMVVSVCLTPFGLLNSLTLLLKEYTNWISYQWVDELAIAIFMSFFFIFSIAITVYTPKRIKEDFTNEFPQFVES